MLDKRHRLYVTRICTKNLDHHPSLSFCLPRLPIILVWTRQTELRVALQGLQRRSSNKNKNKTSGPLFSEHEHKFDYTPETLNDFLQALDEISQEYGWEYDGTGIAWGDMGVVMIAEEPYSTNAKGVRTVNKAAKET